MTLFSLVGSRTSKFSPINKATPARRAVAWWANRKVIVQRVLMDNGGGYRARLSRALIPRAPAGLHPWLRYYHGERPHASLNDIAPWARLRCNACMINVLDHNT